jgi:hypothetical protein
VHASLVHASLDARGRTNALATTIGLMGLIKSGLKNCSNQSALISFIRQIVVLNALV